MKIFRTTAVILLLSLGCARAGTLVAFDPAKPPEAWKTIITGLAKQRPIESGFVENRYMRLRQKPFEVPGVMRYLPGTGVCLVRQGDSGEEAVLVKEDGLYRRDKEGKFNRIPYDGAATRAPRLMLAVVGFDAGRLAKEFTVEGEVNGDYWTMELRPRSPEIAAAVSRMRVTGFRDRLMSITLYDEERVRIEILIKTVAFPESFTPEIRKSCFGQ